MNTLIYPKTLTCRSNTWCGGHALEHVEEESRCSTIPWENCPLCIPCNYDGLSFSIRTDVKTMKQVKTVNDLFLWNLWLDLAGKSEEFIDTNPNNYGYEIIKNRNWNQSFHDLADQYISDIINDLSPLQRNGYYVLKNQFLRLCLNRMIQGFYRYGELGNQGMIDRATYLMKKGKYYEETGNKEALLDAANVAMAAYTEEGFYNVGDMPRNPYPDVSAGYLITREAEYYKNTKNQSCLVIIRNTALMEWIFEKNPQAHFESLQDQDHGERIKQND